MQGHIKWDFFCCSSNDSTDFCPHGGAGGASLVPLSLSSTSYQPHVACGHKAGGTGGHRPSKKARGEKEEGFFESPDISHEEVPAVLGGEALLWDLGLQGPPEGRRQRQAEGSWQGLKTSSERMTFAQREGRAGRGPFPSPRICPALSKHQLIFLTPR